MRGIHCAVTRRTESGMPVGESQRTTLTHAIHSFAINGAYASFEEDRKGSIEVGELADLVVLDGSILSASPEGILSMKPTLTMINGEIVFGGEDEGGPEGRGNLSTAAGPAR